MERFLSSWQELVNLMLVPLYSACILVYICRMFLDEFWIKFLHHSSFDTVKKKKQASSVATTTTTTTEPQLVPEEVLEEGDEGHVNMTGSYKLISNQNYEAFLAVQGVNSFLRRAANQARPTHKITHRGKSVTIQIQGIIESQTTYQVEGPPVETNVRGRVFMDQMTYLPDGIIVTKTAVKEAYDVTVARRLSEDRKTITLTGRATFRDEREPVEAIQIFSRIE